jgi:hypothetical protein
MAPLKDRINIHGRDPDASHPNINDDELRRLW